VTVATDRISGSDNDRDLRRLVVKVLVNIAAGRGMVSKVMSEVESILVRKNVEHEVLMPKTEAEAAALAAELGEQEEQRILVVGGDGTVRSIAVEMVSKPGIVAIVPAGSGNDFAKALGLPIGDLAACVTSAISHEPVEADVGKVHTESADGIKTAGFFVNTLGIGIDAAIAYRSQRIQWLRGFPLYLLALLQTLPGYRLRRYEVTLDGKQYPGTYHMIVVGNGICEGGGFFVTPEADISDGFFDVCLIQGVSKWNVIKILPMILFRKHHLLKEVTFVRARQVSVRCEHGTIAHADGEILGMNLKKVEVSLIPKALRVV
jgi:YegS/Rv2252/BmrU family lipid kinase